MLFARRQASGHVNLAEPSAPLGYGGFSDGWKRKRYFKGHKGESWAASFSPDGKLLATASMDDTARIWDVRSGISLRTLAGHRQGASGVAFSPDAKTLAVVSQDTEQQIVKLWNIATYREVADLRINKRVAFVSFSPGGHNLVAWASWYPMGNVEFWQSTKGR